MTPSPAPQPPPPPVTVRAVTVSGTPLIVGDPPKQFTAVASLSNNSAQDVTNTATWASSNTVVATGSSQGAVTARAEGLVDIRATYQGVDGATTITVSQAVHNTLNTGPNLANASFAPSVRAQVPGFFSLAYDDFVAPSSSMDQTLSWQGVYCPSSIAVAQSPVMSGFTIAFYADRNNRVVPAFTPFQSADYPITQITQSRDLTSIGACTNDSFYTYSVTLAPPLQVQAGVRYWISIQAIMPTVVNRDGELDVQASWGVRHGVRDNGYAVSQIGAEYALQSRDLAFALR
jgi:hypothetical protein